MNIGTLRMVVDYGDNYVLKKPINILGELANNQEYQNSLTNTFVAETKLHRGVGFLMEKLSNLKTYDYSLTNEELISNLVIDFGVSKQYASDLVNSRYNNRLQVGLNSKGEVKIFDAEDAKARIQIHSTLV